jgi:hypothetical protein
MPGRLKNWNGSSGAHSGVRKQAFMQPREDRHSPHTAKMMTACIKAFETWGTCRRVSFISSRKRYARKDSFSSIDGPPCLFLFSALVELTLYC